MHRPILLVGAILLTACVDPRERCISNATHDLSQLDARIAEAEMNVARGYRLEDPVIDSIGAQFCTKTGNLSLCLGGDKEVAPRHVPIDLNAERSLLAALKNQRASQQVTMEREISACQSL